MMSGRPLLKQLIMCSLPTIFWLFLCRKFVNIDQIVQASITWRMWFCVFYLIVFTAWLNSLDEGVGLGGESCFS